MKEINIYGVLNNATPDGVIAKAEQIKDSTQGKKQSDINADYKKRIETLEADGGTGSGGTTDYTDLTNKPQINNVELSGNKSASDLGLQAAGDYALKSEIPDISGLATKNELNDVKPTIGENGNWVLGEEDTGVKAQGPRGLKGEQGNSGVSGTTDNIVVVNDLNGGESTPEEIKVLAAEQGKVLNEKFTELSAKCSLYKKAVYGKNLLDKDSNGIIKGKYLSFQDGKEVIVSNEDYCISNYIEIIGGSTYFGQNINEGGADSIFYDENLLPISSFKTSNKLAIKAPSNAKWARLTCLIRNINNAQFELGEKFTSFEPFTDSYDLEKIRKSIDRVDNIQVNNTLKYFNVFNKEDSGYKEDCFINNLGVEVTNSYSSVYAVTGFIRVPVNFECVSINYEVGNVFAALYDKDKTCISSVQLDGGNRKIDYVEGAYYVRFTLRGLKKDTTIIAFELIDTGMTYTPYGVVYKLDKQSDDYIKNLAKDLINSFIPKYDNKNSSSLTDGGELILENIPDSKNYYGIGCTFNIRSMGTIKIYKSQDNFSKGEIDIDAINITEYATGGEINTIAHGLSITDGLVVSIIKGTSKTTITLTNTSGEKVSKDLNKWVGSKGGVIKFIAVSGTYNNIVLSHSGTWMDKDTWIFGDSYADFWPKKCYEKNATNFYLDGYSGRGAQGGYDSLLKAFKYGRPKRIVWMLGMNNADSEISVNESWNTVFDNLKELCETMNIQLIPCTIPNVPERIHTFKNKIIRESGLPYIDISSALGANEKGSSWFEGLLGSDRVHPTPDKGCEVIANTLIAGVPDIAE